MTVIRRRQKREHDDHKECRHVYHMLTASCPVHDLTNALTSYEDSKETHGRVAEGTQPLRMASVLAPSSEAIGHAADGTLLIRKLPGQCLLVA